MVTRAIRKSIQALSVEERRELLAFIVESLAEEPVDEAAGDTGKDSQDAAPRIPRTSGRTALEQAMEEYQATAGMHVR
ncbi:hypothetical protein [Nocardioides limicola]|uniref:hypothetical protein n=1 Tax=Nocardioides limicola TaxID=2803368 RepID=UPI00193B09C9|nr:hypothetical protein [Nocardioides sp. DJM-14]